MKAIYYNIFGLGHINPTLPLVKALVARGVEIVYHTSPERRGLVESAGAEYRNYGRDNYQAADYNPGKNFVLQTIPAAVGLLPHLLAEIEREKPDFLLYDSMAPWGKVLAHVTGLPAFCTVSTFALSQTLRREMFATHGVELDATNMEAMETVRREFGLELPLVDALGAYGNCNFVFTAREFNPPLGMADEAFHFVGSLARPSATTGPFPIPELAGHKVITMALGTLLPEEDPSVLEWYRTFLRAFSGEGKLRLVVSAGTEANVTALGTIPTNALVRASIPQADVLERTDVFINHGGMNSVNEALARGVPQLIIPHSKDQFVNAERVKLLGVGRTLRRQDVTTAHLRSEVLGLLYDSPTQQRCRQMRENFRSCLGEQGMVDTIMARVSA